jgi:hypothetical protein
MGEEGLMAKPFWLTFVLIGAMGFAAEPSTAALGTLRVSEAVSTLIVGAVFLLLAAATRRARQPRD